MFDDETLKLPQKFSAEKPKGFTGESETPYMWICTRCGAKLDENNLCTGCGAEYRTAEPAQNYQNRNVIYMHVGAPKDERFGGQQVDDELNKRIIEKSSKALREFFDETPQNEREFVEAFLLALTSINSTNLYDNPQGLKMVDYLLQPQNERYMREFVYYVDDKKLPGEMMARLLSGRYRGVDHTNVDAVLEQFDATLHRLQIKLGIYQAIGETSESGSNTPAVEVRPAPNVIEKKSGLSNLLARLPWNRKHKQH